MSHDTAPSLFPDDWARTRATDPDTSHAAADSNTNRRAVMTAVLGLFKTLGPMTDEELTAQYEARSRLLPPAHGDSPRKRRSDLANEGLLVATEMRRPTRSGRNAVVWTVA